MEVPVVAEAAEEEEEAGVSEQDRRLSEGLKIARVDKRQQAVDLDRRSRTAYSNEKKPAGGKFSFRAV